MGGGLWGVEYHCREGMAGLECIAEREPHCEQEVGIW